jgi:hypothetical protein
MPPSKKKNGPDRRKPRKHDRKKKARFETRRDQKTISGVEGSNKKKQHLNAAQVKTV